MFAIIHPGACDSSICLLPVAGRPLIVRQLQWLRANGCERVSVVLPAGRYGDAVAKRLEREPVAQDATIERGTPSLGAVASRAGFEGRRFLAIPYDAIGDGDLSSLYGQGDAVRATLQPPSALPLGNAAHIELRTAQSGEFVEVKAAGWGASIRNAADALLLGNAVLGHLLPDAGGDHLAPIQVHGREIQFGVWMARGARIHPTAHICGPAWIGAGSIVEADAEIGPGSHLEERVVIGERARTTQAWVQASTIVEDGEEIRNGYASHQGIASFAGGGMRPGRVRPRTPVCTHPMFMMTALALQLLWALG